MIYRPSIKIINLQKIRQLIDQKNSLFKRWISQHNRVKSNEWVDKAAKEEARTEKVQTAK